MKAIFYSKYGTPEVLKRIEVEKPHIKENEVLVEVRATSINSWDWDLIAGKPRIYRILFGLRRPKYNILGCDIAGTVVKTGAKVTRFKTGDAVFGDVSGNGFGAFAEYVAVPQDALVLKPREISFEEAAAIPQAGVLAIQGIQDMKNLNSSHKILINGAGGGVGTFALQMAKIKGAHVTCVDSKNKLEMLRELGADEVQDYEKDDFTKSGKLYDLILDVVGKHTARMYKKCLTSDGLYAMVGGKVSSILNVALTGSMVTLGTQKKVKILVHIPNKHLEKLAGMVAGGEIKPVIDKIFPLDDIRDAFYYFGDSKHKGKIIIVL